MRWTEVISSILHDRGVQFGVPDAGTAATDTIGGAIGVAAELPEPLAGALLAAARGVRRRVAGAAIVGPVVMAAVAVLATTLLESVKPVDLRPNLRSCPVDAPSRPLHARSPG
jgi:hypothetical protein